MAWRPAPYIRRSADGWSVCPGFPTRRQRARLRGRRRRHRKPFPLARPDPSWRTAPGSGPVRPMACLAMFDRREGLPRHRSPAIPAVARPRTVWRPGRRAPSPALTRRAVRRGAKRPRRCRGRARCSRQHPGIVNRYPTPHSSPGRWYVLPSCAWGPHSGGVATPSGPVAVAARSPVPVIRQTILVLSPTRIGKELNTSPCSCAVPALPVSSGTPDVAMGDAGEQLGAPRGTVEITSGRARWWCWRLWAVWSWWAPTSGGWTCTPRPDPRLQLT